MSKKLVYLYQITIGINGIPRNFIYASNNFHQNLTKESLCRLLEIDEPKFQKYYEMSHYLSTCSDFDMRFIGTTFDFPNKIRDITKFSEFVGWLKFLTVGLLIHNNNGLSIQKIELIKSLRIFAKQFPFIVDINNELQIEPSSSVYMWCYFKNNFIESVKKIVLTNGIKYIHYTDKCCCTTECILLYDSQTQCLHNIAIPYNATSFESIFNYHNLPITIINNCKIIHHVEKFYDALLFQNQHFLDAQRKLKKEFIERNYQNSTIIRTFKKFLAEFVLGKT